MHALYFCDLTTGLQLLLARLAHGLGRLREIVTKNALDTQDPSAKKCGGAPRQDYLNRTLEDRRWKNNSAEFVVCPLNQSNLPGERLWFPLKHFDPIII